MNLYVNKCEGRYRHVLWAGEMYMNLLITSAGRRGYIIQYFKEALKGRGKVYAGNSSALSPAFYYADEYVVTPLIYDKAYIPFLLEFCRKEKIKILLSLFDIDLFVLAKHKKMFEEEGVCVIVSSEPVIRICNDKWNTFRFCMQNDILYPQTYLSLKEAEDAIAAKNLQYPVIVKPRWGMGSLAVYQADNLEEMRILVKKCKRDIQSSYLKFEAAFDMEHCVIIQEMLTGKEYGMDIINDLNGTFCCNIVRRKYAMRAGETDCAAIESNSDLDLLAAHISRALGHIGNLDADLFATENGYYLLEMNARLGGGNPFSHMAGINYPQAVLKWVEGIPLENELALKEQHQVIQKDIQFVNLSEFFCEGGYSYPNDER